jgi:hypothetical protein
MSSKAGLQQALLADSEQQRRRQKHSRQQQQPVNCKRAVRASAAQTMRTFMTITPLVSEETARCDG